MGNITSVARVFKVLIVGTLAAGTAPTPAAAAAAECGEQQVCAAAAAVAAPPSLSSKFSPYVESWADVNLKSIPGRSVTLAFVLSQNNKASWDGSMPLNHWLARAKASGKRIVLSFGGAAGTELALAIKDPKALAGQYALAAKMYAASRLDFDVEGWTVNDKESVKRRNQALKLLQTQLPTVALQYTLAVMPHGLDEANLDILRDAKNQGIKLDAVNLMTMNYGESYTGDMGAYAIQAAQATRKQLRDLGLKGVGIGITPMILENDVKANVFSLQDAKQVADFAAKTQWVRFVGFWAAGRDASGQFSKVFSKV